MKVKCIKYFDTANFSSTKLLIFKAGETYDCIFSDIGTIMLMHNGINIKITKLTFDAHFIEVSDFREEQINKLIK